MVGVSNLPRHLTPFVGRVSELRTLARLVAAHRFVNVVGAGGCGKTRLVVQAAPDLGTLAPDGVYFCDLAGLAPGQGVVDELARVLDLRDLSKATAIQALADRLGGRKTLLILDNCEHLADDVARTVEPLLRACDELRVLATSRSPVGVEGELTWRLPPLSLRSNGSDVSDAVALFLARARVALPEKGEWSAAELDMCGRICARVDGIALAIELAAGRTSALSLSALDDHLSNGLGLLSAGARGAPARQRTIAATIDWSYGLLSDPAAALLRRLSVFGGSFTLDSAVAVCAGGVVHEQSVPQSLAELVDHSVVVAEPVRDDLRYRLLGPLRTYSAERLAESGERNDALSRCCDYYIAFADRHQAAYRSEGQLAAVRAVDGELDNLRASLSWAFSSDGDAVRGQRLVSALGLYWYLRGYTQEAARWTEAALAAPVTSEWSARVEWAAGLYSLLQGDLDRARRLLGSAVKGERERGDPVQLALCLGFLGIAMERDGDWEAALSAASAAAPLALDDEPWLQALRLRVMAHAHKLLGDMAQVKALHLQELTRARAAGDHFLTASALNCLAEAEREAGQFQQARALYEESARLREELGDRLGIVICYGNLALLAVESGDSPSAIRFLYQALRRWDQLSSIRNLAPMFVVLAEVLRLSNKAEGAARCLGMSRRALEPRVVLDHADEPVYQRSVKRLKATLGRERFEQSFAEGFAIPAVAAIRETLTRVEGMLEARVDAPYEGPGGPLSEREAEVLELVAAGASNREIADRLVISVRTVESHVSNICTKLGVRTRGQAAARARELGPQKPATTDAR